MGTVLSLAPAPSFLERNFWLLLIFLGPGIICAVLEDPTTWLILKWLGRLAVALLMIPLAFLAWYTVAAIPVSVAIILGAIIIVCGMRSTAGRMRRFMGRIPEEGRRQTLEHQAPAIPNPAPTGHPPNRPSYWQTNPRVSWKDYRG